MKKINPYKTCLTCKNYKYCSKYLLDDYDLWHIGNSCPQYEPVKLSLKDKIMVLIMYLFS